MDIADLGQFLGGAGGLIGGVSGLFGGKSGRQIDPVQFATSQIQWRVADAKAAGIHPLYALGMNPSYPPADYVGGAAGPDLGAMGQGLERAGAALAKRSDKFTAQMQALALQRGELENQLLVEQIKRMNAPGTPPPLPDDAYLYQSGPPIGQSRLDSRVWTQPLAPGGQPSTALPGQGDAAGVKIEPVEVSPTFAPGGHQEVGIPGETRFNRTERGLTPMPSKQGGIDDLDITSIPYLQWMVRNNILPSLGLGGKGPPPEADRLLPKDATGWEYSPVLQEWVPSYWKSIGGWKNPWFRPRSKSERR